MQTNKACLTESLAHQLDKAGVGIISNNAGRAIPAAIPEEVLHAEFLLRDDIARLSSAEQAVQWNEHKKCIEAILRMLDSVPLYGFR